MRKSPHPNPQRLLRVARDTLRVLDMREEFAVISHVLPLDLGDYWVAPGQPLDEGR